MDKKGSPASKKMKIVDVSCGDDHIISDAKSSKKLSSTIRTPDKKADISRRNRENYIKRKDKKKQTIPLTGKNSHSTLTDMNLLSKIGGQTYSVSTEQSVPKRSLQPNPPFEKQETVDSMVSGLSRVNSGVISESNLLHVVPVVSSIMVPNHHDISLDVLPGGLNFADLLQNPAFISKVNAMFGTSLCVSRTPQCSQPEFPSQYAAGLERYVPDKLHMLPNLSHEHFQGLSSAKSISVQGFELGTSSSGHNVSLQDVTNTIADIIPSTPLPWKVKVRVVEKAFRRVSRNPVNPVTYLRTILMDNEGTRVQATIFGQDIDVMEKKLPLLKRCFISNAIVQPISPEHRIVQNQFQWSILAKSTLIEEISDDDSGYMVNPYSLVPFTDFANYLNYPSPIDVLAVVIDILPVKPIDTINGAARVQQVLLVDQLLKPVTLSLWDQFVDHEGVALTKLCHERTIIVATRVKVVPFKGLSLATKTFSTILINPDFIDANNLRSWCLQNNSALQSLVNYVTQSSTGVKDISQAPTNVIFINDAIQLNENVSFWVKANVSVTNFRQNFWYMSCNKCNRATTTEFDQIFTCNFCNSDRAVAKPRCRVEVQLDDSSGCLQGTLFGEKAEIVLECNAVALMKGTKKNDAIDITHLMNTCSKEPILLQLKPYIYRRDNDLQKRYNINEINMILEGNNNDRGKRKLR